MLIVVPILGLWVSPARSTYRPCSFDPSCRSEVVRSTVGYQEKSGRHLSTWSNSACHRLYSEHVVGKEGEAEGNVGFQGQGEVVGIEAQAKVKRGWSTQRGRSPSPSVGKGGLRLYFKFLVWPRVTCVVVCPSSLLNGPGRSHPLTSTC